MSLERIKAISFESALDLGYPLRFLKKICEAKGENEVTNIMIDARRSDEIETRSHKQIYEALNREGIIPPMKPISTVWESEDALAEL